MKAEKEGPADDRRKSAPRVNKQIGGGEKLGVLNKFRPSRHSSSRRAKQSAEREVKSRFLDDK